MQLHVLGKYGPYPAPNGGTSSYLLTHGDDALLLDCGSGALSRLSAIMDPTKLTAVVLSHLHFDHMSDMLVLRYCLEAYKKHGDRVSPITVYAPDGPALVRELLNCDLFDLREACPGMTAKAGGFGITFGEMRHPVPALGVRVTAGARTLAYTGDTVMHDGLIPFCEGADALVIDSALLSRDHREGAPHLSAAQAGQVGAAANVPLVIASHIFCGYDEEDVLAEVRSSCPHAVIAQEGKTYQI